MRTLFFGIVLLSVSTIFGQAQSSQQHGPGFNNIDIRAVGPSGTERIPLDPAKIADLAVLGKVWGFLKYHHPTVATSTTNWDLELFRLLPEILAAESALQRNNILYDWAKSLGDFPFPGSPNAANIKLAPDLAWINSRDLGPRLSKYLTLVKNAARTGQNRYVSLTPFAGNPVFQNEDPYTSLAYPNPNYQLLALFRYWSMILYFFPNRHLMGENWNSVMTEYVPRFYNAANETEYKMAAWSLIGRIHDTHANIWSAEPVLTAFRGVNAVPVRVKFIEDEAVVTGYWNELGLSTGLKIGDVIETINGQTVDDFVAEHLEYTPASNYPTQLRDLALYILRTNNAFLNIGYTRDGVSFTTQARAYPRETVINPAAVHWDPTTPPFRLIGTDIAHLFPATLQPGQINALIPQIAPTRGLIIDLRCYPSQFIVFSFGNFLMPAQTDFVKFSNASITTPGLFTFVDGDPVGPAAGPHYTGKVVILVNEITQSSAEYTAMAFRVAPQAVVIGSTTAGADGNVSEIVLPGGIRTLISGIGVYYPDGRETQRIGIVPDIIKRPTIQGIKEGRDELLEKALEVINSN